MRGHMAMAQASGPSRRTSPGRRGISPRTGGLLRARRGRGVSCTTAGAAERSGGVGGLRPAVPLGPRSPLQAAARPVPRTVDAPRSRRSGGGARGLRGAVCSGRAGGRFARWSVRRGAGLGRRAHLERAAVERRRRDPRDTTARWCAPERFLSSGGRGSKFSAVRSVYLLLL